jgi:Pentapeptide repeats (9 copies)
MTRDETIALFEACEAKRAEARAAALAEGKDEDEARSIAHEAAKARWNAWAEPLLAERKAMETDGRWAAEKALWGSLEPQNAETRAWLEKAAADFSRCLFLALGAGEAKEGEEATEGTGGEPPAKSIQLEGDSANFSGFIFPGDAGFESAAFYGYARFGNATFSGGTTFANATFSSYAGFDSATFSGNTGFGSATFSGHAGFGNATFSGNVGFRRTAFSGAWFDSAIFSGHARFDSTTFSGSAQFGRTAFSGDAWFGSAAFSGDAGFASATFSGDARFDSAVFSGHAGFGSATFSGDAWFGRAIFSGDASFGSATFGGGSHFENATFRGDAYFGSVTFEKDVFFQRARFSMPANFALCDFRRHATFKATHFAASASFAAIRAGRGFNIAGAAFEVVPDFIQAHFEEAPRLDNLEVGFALPGLAEIEDEDRAKLGRRGRWHRERLEKYSWYRRVFEAVSKDSDLHNIPARWRALKRLAIQGHDTERELEFHARELRSQRFTGDWPLPWRGKGAHMWKSVLGFWSGLAYGLFSNYGRSLLQPALFWLAGVALGAVCYVSQSPAMIEARAAARASGSYATVATLRMAAEAWLVKTVPCHAGGAIPPKDADGNLPPYIGALSQSLQSGTDIANEAWHLAFRNAFIVLDGSNEAAHRTYGCLYGVELYGGSNPLAVVPSAVSTISAAQKLFSALMIFLFGLALRNMLKMK